MGVFMKWRILVLSAFLCLAACGDDDSDFATRPDGKGSSSNSRASEGYVDPSTVVKGIMTDERDGQTYETVTIGSQTWMAENLNYAYTDVPYNYKKVALDTVSTSDSTSWCYNDSAEYCAKYGRIYTWAAAMDSVGVWSTNGKGCGYGKACSPTYPVRGVCPEGWHLPSKAEFEILFESVGGAQDIEYDYKWHGVGTVLKFTTEWNSGGNGTDIYAFSVLPAGRSCYGANFYSEGTNAYFWNSTEEDDGYHAYYTYFYYDYDYVRLIAYYDESNGFSVRCVKD